METAYLQEDVMSLSRLAVLGYTYRNEGLNKHLSYIAAGEHAL
jgi:hypothetical protein